MPNSRCAYSWPRLVAIGFAVAPIAVAPFAAAAQSNQMSNDAIREAVSGATVHLDAPLGTTIPLEFDADGRVTGTAGRLAFYLGAATDTGRWWTANNRLCYRWMRWFNGEPSCMKIARQGATFAWESDQGRTGTAKIVQRRAVAAVPSPAAVPPPSASTPVAAAPMPAKFDTPKPETVLPSAPAAPRFAVAGAGAGAKPSSASKGTEIAKSAKPAAVPSLPPSSALGGPVAAGSLASRPVAAGLKAVAAKPIAAKPNAAAGIGSWDTRIERKAAPPSPRAAASATASGQALANSQLPVAAIPGWRVVNVDLDDVLNVRAEPFAGAAVVGMIPPGGRGVLPLGMCHGAWCRVRWLAHDGWVHSAFVAPDGTR